MFKWYPKAARCYAYLSDIERASIVKVKQERRVEFDLSIGRSIWFTRGWTLQELIAPKDLVFLDSQWQVIITKARLAPILASITGISCNIIESGFTPGCVSVATIFSWMSARSTTRIEDMSYCLLGLLNINMPLLYGEGKNAFSRLQKTFIENSNDMSLFLWDDHHRYFKPRRGKPLLAPLVTYFNKGDLYCTEDMINDYWDDPQVDTHLHTLVQHLSTSYTVSNRGLDIQAFLMPDMDVEGVPKPQPGSCLMLTNVIRMPQPSETEHKPFIMAINITKRWTGLSAINGARPLYLQQAGMEKIDAWKIDESLAKLEVVNTCLNLDDSVQVGHGRSLAHQWPYSGESREFDRSFTPPPISAGEANRSLDIWHDTQQEETYSKLTSSLVNRRLR